MKVSLHQTFHVWPLRLIVISLIVVLAALAFAPVSKLFLVVAVGLGMLDSLSTIEQLTGGREIYLVSIPVLVVSGFFGKAMLFESTTVAESVALYFQFAAVIVLVESFIVFLLRSRLEDFCMRRALK